MLLDSPWYTLMMICPGHVARKIWQTIEAGTAAQTAEHFGRRAFLRLPALLRSVLRFAFESPVAAKIERAAGLPRQVQTVSSLCIIISFCKMALNEYLSICGAGSANENFDRRADSCQGSSKKQWKRAATLD